MIRRAHPTRLSDAVFSAKAALHQARRATIDMVAGPGRLTRGEGPPPGNVVVSSITELRGDVDPAEQAAQAGKIENLRLACRALDGLDLPAGATFSFWRQVGPPTAARGFVPGRMLKEGCMTMAVGGGLCQLSNALYDVAQRAGCRIVERHPHSRVVPGSAAAAAGRDATVAWNYVDLRFAPDRPSRLVARLDNDQLVVGLVGDYPPGEATSTQVFADARPAPPIASRCAACGETRCHRHERPRIDG
jgi:hypothetical protein